MLSFIDPAGEDGEPLVTVVPVQRIQTAVQLVPNLAATAAVPAGSSQYTDVIPLRYPWTGQASADIARAHFKPAKRGKKSRLTKVTTKAKVKRGN